MDAQLHKFAELCSRLEHYTVKTAARETVAKEVLTESEGRHATPLLMALRTLYGIDVLYWEPETIWLTLERDYSIDLDIEARDKIQAAISLIRNPAFFWDNLVFQRTTQSLNGELYDPETLQECHPAHMSWAVYEATLLRGMDPESDARPEIDEDVQQYIAVCLCRAGYVYPPNLLEVIADNLEKLLPGADKGFITKVKQSWERLDKKGLEDRKFDESPLDIQLAQLASCYLYVKEQADKLATDVLWLEKSDATFSNH
jgi:hypothetical protein